MTPVPAPPAVVDWGRTGYADALRRQEELVAARRAGTAPDTLVFTEHDPVFTLGVRRGAERHLLWGEAELARRGIAPADGTVTSMALELGRPLDLATVKAVLAREFARRLPGFLAGDDGPPP